MSDASVFLPNSCRECLAKRRLSSVVTDKGQLPGCQGSKIFTQMKTFYFISFCVQSKHKRIATPSPRAIVFREPVMPETAPKVDCLSSIEPYEVAQVFGGNVV